jgi:hypothetical protein
MQIEIRKTALHVRYVAKQGEARIFNPAKLYIVLVNGKRWDSFLHLRNARKQVLAAFGPVKITYSR